MTPEQDYFCETMKWLPQVGMVLECIDDETISSYFKSHMFEPMLEDLKLEIPVRREIGIDTAKDTPRSS